VGCYVCLRLFWVTLFSFHFSVFADFSSDDLYALFPIIETGLSLRQHAKNKTSLSSAAH